MQATSQSPARAEFLATLAHELRNPLSAIQAALRVLENPTAASRQEARALIDRQVLRIARLSDDLLDVGYLASGQPRLHRETVDLRDLVHAATDACRTQLEAGHFAVVLLLPPQPVMIDADPLRMIQVLTNLLDNAAKYSEPYGMIVVSVEETPCEIRLCVVDHGIGMSADVLPQVFDLFVQADGARTRSRHGMGIGLNVVKRIVELHRGTVQAFSAGPDLGSTFTIRLPRHP